MSLVVREFNSLPELVKFVDEQIATYRNQLAEFLKRLEDVRVRAEQEKRLKDLLKSLGVAEGPKPVVVDLREAKLIINPSAEDESKAVEEVIERLNKNIQVLQAVRKGLEPLANVDVEAKITVILRDGIPSSILVKVAL